MKRLFLFLGAVLALPPIAGAAERIRDPENGCATSNPYPRPDETIQWSGKCLNGLLHGKGVLIWMRKGVAIERDEGTFRNGELEGAARILFADGSTIWGNYRQGVRDGEFLIQRPDGSYIRAIYDRGTLLREESLTRKQLRDLRARRAKGQKLKKVAAVPAGTGAQQIQATDSTAAPPLSVTAPAVENPPAAPPATKQAAKQASVPAAIPARTAPATSATTIPATASGAAPHQTLLKLLPPQQPASGTSPATAEMAGAIPFNPVAGRLRLPVAVRLSPPALTPLSPSSAGVAPAKLALPSDDEGLIPYPFRGGGVIAAPVLHPPAAAKTIASPGQRIVLRPPAPPPPPATGDTAKNGQRRYTIDFRATPAADAVRLMLGEMLKIPYRFEGRLQGTLSTPGPQIVSAGEIPGYLAALIAPLGGQLLRDQNGYIVRGNVPVPAGANDNGNDTQAAQRALLAAYRLESAGNDNAALTAYRQVAARWPASTAAMQARQRHDALAAKLNRRRAAQTHNAQARTPPRRADGDALLGKRVCSAAGLYGAKARWCGTVLQAADGRYKVEVDEVSPGSLLALGFEADTCTGGVFLSRFGGPVTIWVPRPCLDAG